MDALAIMYLFEEAVGKERWRKGRTSGYEQENGLREATYRDLAESYESERHKPDLEILPILFTQL